MTQIVLDSARELERLGELTVAICSVVDSDGLSEELGCTLDSLIGDMGEALSNRDLRNARVLVLRMLSEILGYEPNRAKFIMSNHLNPNTNWL